MQCTTPTAKFSETSSAEPVRLLLSTRETARALSVCQRTLSEITRRSDLPCVRIGRSGRYAIADIREYIAKNRTSTK